MPIVIVTVVFFVRGGKVGNMVIGTNILALNAYRGLKRAGVTKAISMRRLSSGLRINSASDDAAGLAISEKMRSQIRGIEQASRNSQDAISAIQTADGGLSQAHDIMQRMRELVVQGSNDTLNDNDKEKINLELNELAKELNDQGSKLNFNGKRLLNGSTGNKFLVQTGANEGETMNIDFSAADLTKLNMSQMAGNIDITGGSAVTDDFLKKLDKDIDTVSMSRATLGAQQNRLGHTVNFLDTYGENLSAAESRIRDADMAKEMMNLVRSNVLEQAAMSMLAQANRQQMDLLNLLR